MSANRLTLDATLASLDTLRFTPAGVPAIEMRLEHESTQLEAGHERKVACELFAIALGPLARTLAALRTGVAIRCEGFLARRYKSGGVALHLTEFELI